MIANLVSNAFKYGADGRTEVRLVVRDEGTRMFVQDIPRPFVRCESASMGKKENTR